MPTLAAPGYLLAAALGAAVVVALHLLAWRRPAPTPLPTARFAPPSAIRALSRDLRLSDILLMIVRAGALLLAGLALAGPGIAPRRAGTARVLVLDASRRVARMDDVRDSARTRATGIDAVRWIRVDSIARLLADSVVGERADTRGNLAGGFVAAVREAHRLAATHERVDVVVVSPFAAESWNAAMEGVRGEWAGGVTAVRVAARASRDSTSPTGNTAPATVPASLLPPLADPIGAVFALAIDTTVPALRVVRDAPSASDSSFARAGGVLVSWPPGASAESAAPARASILSDGARSAAGRFRALESVSLAGTPIVRWGDGRPAATEAPLGAGCLRTVAIGVPSAGDDVLRPAFVRLVRELALPCGGGSAEVVDAATVTAWANGAGPARPAVPGSSPGSNATGAAARAPARPAERSREVQRWLLVSVALCLLLEWWLRGRTVRVRGDDVASPLDAREAA